MENCCNPRAAQAALFNARPSHSAGACVARVGVFAVSGKGVSAGLGNR